MNNNELKVCILIVTYNRKNYLLKLLAALEHQTIRPKKIIIFDNYSNDGTSKVLMQQGYVNEVKALELSKTIKGNIEFLYYRNNENSGGSGGFHDGLNLASEQECDYIWTMDDDVLPANNCLENLLLYVSDTSRICIPSRTDNKFNDFAITKVNMNNPFKYNTRLRKTKVYNENISGNYISVSDMPFEGPLIANSLIKEIGLPKKDLFIIFDDSEYAYRATKVTEIRYVKTAILHKQIVPQKVSNRLMGWKEYYGLRNQYWFDRTYGENMFVKIMRPFLSFTELSVKAIIKRKWSNLKVLRKAYYDGTKGLLGKNVIPGENIK